MTKPQEKQSIFDLTAQNYGNLDEVVKFSKDNALNVNDEPDKTKDIVVEDSVDLGNEKNKNAINLKRLTFNNRLIKLFEIIDLKPYVWLDSSVGVRSSISLGVSYIYRWEDQSGNGYDVSQSTGSKRPKLIQDNGTNALEFGFNGIGHSLDMLNELCFPDSEVFIIYKATDVASLGLNYILSSSVGRNSASIRYSFYAGGNLVSGFGNTRTFPAPVARLRATIKPVNEKVLMTMLSNQMYKDNIEVSYTSQDTIEPLYIDRIGTRQDAANENVLRFIGNLYEIIVLPKLSVENRTKVFEYLESKYNGIV